MNMTKVECPLCKRETLLRDFRWVNVSDGARVKVCLKCRSEIGFIKRNSCRTLFGKEQYKELIQRIKWYKYKEML